MKVIIGVVVVVLIALGAWFVMGSGVKAPGEDSATPTNAEGRSVVTSGTYRLDPVQSEFKWAGKKPLIEGYINSGTIGVTDGTVIVDGTKVQGVFSLDMNTLKVGLTAAKPGKEGALEGHLKSDKFFDVAKYPVANFTIKSVTPTSDSDTTFVYVITGDLVMKGKTNEISFPATIFQKDGVLTAEAQTEIDRTKWDLTYGSGNFFEDLGDNLIDDMVAVSFKVVAPLVRP